MSVRASSVRSPCAQYSTSVSASRCAARPRLRGAVPAPPARLHSASEHTRFRMKQQIDRRYERAVHEHELAADERRMIDADVDQPCERHALPRRRRWKRSSRSARSRTAAGGDALLKRERGQRAGGLADVPLDRMQAVAAVGDVGGAEVLAAGDQVRRSRTGSSAPSGIWNGLVRQLAPTSSGPERWMSIGYQPTPTESAKWRRARPLLVVRGHVLLDDRLQRPDAPRLADVRMLREAVGACPSRRAGAGAPGRRAARPVAGASVCSQCRKPRLTRFASCSARGRVDAAGQSRMLRSR